MVPDGVNQTVPPKREKEPQVEDIFDLEKEARPPEAKPKVEREVAPEVTKEKPPEVRPEAERVEEEMARRKAIPPTALSKKVEPVVKSETQVKIENILAEDLIGFYKKMPQDERIEFRKKGEETASNIEQLMQKTKVKVRKILNLIKKWLKMIPGINKFFLEQEAKIKTDKILDLKEKQNQK